MSSTSAVPRAVCYRCDKPESMCVCASVPRVANRTGVLVIQHPRERAHAIGTARFAKLGLENARVEVAWHADQFESDRPAYVPERAALLYPGPEARDMYRPNVFARNTGSRTTVTAGQ